ncbi:MAG: ABC transporter ATP-binding protein [Candidatus Limnocylindria bacterium]
MTPDIAIEARGWGWRHAGRRAWAIRGLDLRVERGERVLLLGASGAGKSTLLLGLAGLLDPSGGGESEGRLLVRSIQPRAARDETGILFQDPEAQLVMARAGDDVAFGLENRCVSADRIWPRVDAALQNVGWRYGSDRSTAALSGGEKQRLALAGTLALRPRLLLLDEPTANLDPAGAAAFGDTLRQVVSGATTTLVLVEHRVSLLLDLVTRVVVLEAGGGVALDGDPHDLFGARAEELAARGVWLPRPPVIRTHPAAEVQAQGRAQRPALVIAERAGFTYPGSEGAALAPTDVTLEGGHVLAIVGANGSGKSTLVMLLAGLLRPSFGRVIGGRALTPNARASAPIWRWRAPELVRRIGTVFQDPEHQFVTATVRDELRLGPIRSGLDPSRAGARADGLMARLRLSHLAGANPFTLSGGEQRRLSVGTALAAAPPVLLLDEPTFGQDRTTWLELVALLSDLRAEGRAIGFASHDADFVAALADRSLALGAGSAEPGSSAAR